MHGISKRLMFVSLSLALWTCLVAAQDPTNPDETAVAPPLTASDYLAPRSLLHLGPLSFYSVQISGSMSNRPVGNNPGDFIQGAFSPESKSFLGRGSLSMGLSKRFGGGAFSFQYTPSVDYQSMFGYAQVNHGASLTLDRDFRSSGWRFSLGMHGATFNQFSTLMQQEPQFEPVLRLNVPISNLDLLNIISEPTVLVAPQQELLLTGRRMANANAGLNISKRVSTRGSLHASFTYGLNRTFDAETLQGLAFFNYKSNSLSSSFGYSQKITPRQTVGITFTDQRNYFQIGHTELQSVSLSYNVAMGRRWALDMNGGPGLSRALRVFNTPSLTPVSTAFKPTAVGSIALSRTGRNGVFRVAYNRSFYTGGLVGGQTTQGILATYTPALRSSRWRFSLNGGYTWIYGVGGVLQSNGWNVSPSFQYPLSRTLVLGLQY